MSVFRYRHHYFAELRFWPRYADMFAMLDGKAQGLLTAASLMLAAFLLLFIDDTVFLHLDYGLPLSEGESAQKSGLLSFLAFFGLLCVSASTLLLLPLSAIRADPERLLTDRKIAKFEEFFASDTGEIEQEARIEQFIRLYTRTVTSPRGDTGLPPTLSQMGRTCDAAEFALFRFVLEMGPVADADGPLPEADRAEFLTTGSEEHPLFLRRGTIHSYRRVKEEADQIFGHLRDTVEAALLRRRNCYRLARILVLTASCAMFTIFLIQAVDELRLSILSPEPVNETILIAL
ncbi:hypothetical protein [Roseovarius sp. CH_XMU1461]|uniref:hypothetical protein n=1 Tax=Roseovarius sp. CH_XMU1461 TaxID=3107777 RepID=UPI00300A2771